MACAKFRVNPWRRSVCANCFYKEDQHASGGSTSGEASTNGKVRPSATTFRSNNDVARPGRSLALQPRAKSPGMAMSTSLDGLSLKANRGGSEPSNEAGLRSISTRASRSVGPSSPTGRGSTSAPTFGRTRRAADLRYRLVWLAAAR